MCFRSRYRQGGCQIAEYVSMGMPALRSTGAVPLLCVSFACGSCVPGSYECLPLNCKAGHLLICNCGSVSAGSAGHTVAQVRLCTQASVMAEPQLKQ